MDYYFDYDYTPKRKTDVNIYYQDPKELRIDDDDKQVLHDDEYKVKIQKKGDRYYIDHKELKENMQSLLEMMRTMIILIIFFYLFNIIFRTINKSIFNSHSLIVRSIYIK